MLSRLKLPRRSPAPPPEPDVEATTGDAEGAQMSFFDHLEELRQRLFKAVLALVFGTTIGILIATQVLEFLKQPYGRPFTVLGPTGGVVSYFRVALLVGGIIAIPVITYQVLMFVIPGLTQKEKRILLFSIPPVTVLFLIGVAFAWILLIPPALNFLEGFQPTLFKPEWTADLYLGFVTALLFWMGVAFETPLIFFVLSLLGLVSAGPLLRNWRIAIVGAAVAAAMITPTIDPVNMMLVMGPLMALYILSIGLVVIGRRFARID
ncbi:MAG: twin-arginine translocase subunit TatC [Anaerolineae bacterium]|nr:twin-arginine translocase subunit TatC [Anaerolineae bacterium]